MVKYVYKLVFTSSNDPTVEEINKEAQSGWRCIQVGHREGAPNQFVYLMEKEEEIIVEAPSPVSSDDFERADGPLGANWAVPASSEGAILISSTAAKASVPGAICMAYWTATSFVDDQYSEAKLGEIADNIGVVVRMDDSSDHFFMGEASSGTSSKIYQHMDGAWTLLSDSLTTWTTGDSLRLGIRGSVHPFHLNLYRNDDLVCSWTSTGTEQLKNGGSPGIIFYGQNASMLEWSGGDMEGSTDTLVGVFTVSIQDDRILIPSHGLIDGDQVLFVLDDPATCALPTPLVENAYYFVMGARGNDFQVSATQGGTRLIIEDRGIGSNEVWKKGA